MRLEPFMMGFLVFTVVFVTGTLFIGDINNKYGDMGASVDTSNFNESYNSIDDLYNVSVEMKDKTYGAELSSEEPWESSVKGSYSAVRLLKRMYDIFYNIINDVARVIGIPAYMITAAIIAMTIGLVFGLIGLFLKFKE